ncbi:MAG: aminoglycoside phosphotransferase family protein [Bacilli bacterium]|nr:aminoglycoside phosphotransferase family protein [Bacilli bacterium]
MIERIIDKFNIDGKLIDIEVNNSGIINNTYVATFEKEDGTTKKYLIQKINTTVFTEPYKLMKNIEGVTSYLKRQMIKENDLNHQVLEVIKTKDNRSLCYIEENGERDYYRIYEYIENAVTYDCSIDPQIVYRTGKAFGNFQRLLRNYPMSRLSETIKDFHMTDKRYKKLIEDIKIDSEGRVLEVAPEIVFILMREDICSLITEELGTEEVPYRVTHNDTKVNNVMMNKDNGDFLAVIDLDTVMPGSMLFDYGDGVRSTASTAKEDEKDLSKVQLDLELFEAYTKGYLSEMAPYITYEELSLMGESIRIITLELAIRFLNDYINGDTYFKINYEKHNLDRARNQIALVRDIESKLDYINNFINENYKVCKSKTRVLGK